jgi:hypothetical protein
MITNEDARVEDLPSSLVPVGEEQVYYTAYIYDVNEKVVALTTFGY